MLVSEAQQELRTVYDGGLYGRLVSGMVWLLSTALASWYSSRSAIIMLVIGGFFIFPLTASKSIHFRIAVQNNCHGQLRSSTDLPLDCLHYAKRHTWRNKDQLFFRGGN
jgi:hypothetical protein